MMLTTVMIKDENGVEKKYVSLDDYEKLNTQFDRLYTKFVMIPDALVEAKREKDELKEQIFILTRECNTLGARADAAEKKYWEAYNASSEENFKLREKSEAVEQENFKLNDALTYLKTELDEARKKLDESMQKNGELSAELCEVKKKLEEMKGKYCSSEVSRADNLTLWKCKTTENEILRLKIYNLEKKIKAIQGYTDTDIELSKWSEDTKRKIDELTKQLEEERAKTTRKKSFLQRS